MNMMTTGIQPAALETRAMIVNLTISQWSGRRLDRQVTDEVNSSHGASDDAGRYNKLLIPKDALAPIEKIVNATRTDFRKRTLPWIDDGGRIMAADAYLAHSRWIDGQRIKFDAAVEEFVAAYPGLLAEASKRLNTMFKADDYPSPKELRTKFAMAVTVMPVPTADDFRVNMSQAQADRIRADIEENVRQATANAMRDVYRRIADVTGRMVERLTAYKPAEKKGERSEGTFKDSLVENVKDLVEIMPALNIVGDSSLTAIAEEMRALIKHPADTLRVSPTARQDVAAKAREILATVSDYL
ncbi:hypothetical protein HJB99_07735 [Rhizobium sp. NLR17b]|uniref:hypothetical protein n=1 Tax=Rhizobium sp. NLR17b TaxID=2731114 RepID=UPI001C829BE3|nr:hypothetical protein [Rhizobium sp. NLR17b]MBX5268568.1 hypothetical protein [Rhizobium sp. NLR17b]